MKRFLTVSFLFALAVLCCMMCSCTNARKQPMQTTTTTRSVRGFGPESVGSTGVETVTETRPYDPFGEAAGQAGVQLFSQP